MATPTITVSLSVTSAAGAQPTSPAVISANYVGLVSAEQPGYTVLPGGLIEDLSSTGTFGIALCDAAAVESVNSLTPATANPWLLIQLGGIYGVPQGLGSNTSVYVVFSGTVGFQIPPGFLVSDGTYQYSVQDGAAIGSGGASPPVYCVATQAGTWAIPENTVTALSSSVPSAISLTVTNPTPGTPGAAPQTEGQYRAQVLQAGLAPGQGFLSQLKTLLGNVAGVQERLISARLANGGWEIVVGGGDPYATAAAIFSSGVDLSTVVGSSCNIVLATQANPCVVTTNIYHGLTNGQTGVSISGATGMTEINGGPYTVIVLSPTQFSFGVNTTSDPAYTGGGVVTPNSGSARNITVSLNDYPDTYQVTFVNPPLFPATIQLTWNTTSPNFVSDSAVQQLGATAIAAYINGLPVSAPINLNVMGGAFTASVLGLFGGNAALISQLTWTVSINGVETSPTGETFLIAGDPEGAFTCSATAVTITQA